MFKIIFIFTLLYLLKLSAQQGQSNQYNQLSNYGPQYYEPQPQPLLQKLVPRAGYVENQAQQPKPCSRRMLAQDNALENPNVWVPTYPAPVVKPGGTSDSPVLFLKPESLKNDNKLSKAKVVTEKYPEHRHRDFFVDNLDNTEVQQKIKNEEPNAKPNPRRNLLVSEEDDHETRLLPLQTSFNKNLHSGMFNEYTLETRKNEKVEPVKEKPEIKSNEMQHKNSDKKNNCVSYSEDTQADDDVLDTRRSLSNSLEENVGQPNDSVDNKNSQDLDGEDSERNALRANENAVLDPARGAGISQLLSSPVNLLSHTRVCYACSTVNNPTCLQPDRRTTVKYCRPGHEACVTKTFHSNTNEWILTRDCGKSCDDTDIPGPKYKSCSVCHTDMCNDSPNGAPAMNTAKYILGVFVILVVKCTL